MKRAEISGTLVFAARLLILGLICVGLYFGSAVFVPVALALMLSFILSPAVHWLQRYRLPRVAAVLVIVVLASAAIGFLLWIVSVQVTTLVEDIPQHRNTIKGKMADLRGLGKGGSIEKIQETIEEVSEEIEAEEEAEEEAAEETEEALREGLGPAAPRMGATLTNPTLTALESEEPLPVRVVPREGLLAWQNMSFMTPLATILGQTGLVFILVILLLIAEEDLRGRVATLAGEAKLAITTDALSDAGHRISRYLATQLALNAVYGIAVGVGLALLGVPYAVLWGVCATVFRYIPYVGPWVAAVLPIGITILTADGWWPVIWVISLFVVLELISNNVLEPWLYGRSVGVPAFILLISAAFWTWLWGPMGLVLSTPLTVCLVAIGEHVESLKILSRLLGSGSNLSPHLHVYQRLLALDDEMATIEVRKNLPSQGSREERIAATDAICATILAPLLTLIKRDNLMGVLSNEREKRMLAFVQKETEYLDHRDDQSELSEESKPRIMLCPAANEVDETAARVLALVLKNSGVSCRVLSSALLASEVADTVRSAESRVLCIVAVRPGGFQPCLHTCKRMSRLELPSKIAVNYWEGLTEHQREALKEAGAELIADGLREGDDMLTPLDQFYKSANRQGDPPPAHSSLQTQT